MSVLADGEMIVGDGTTDPVAESGATLRTSIGVGTGDSPQFTSVTAKAASGDNASIYITSDDGEDDNDFWRIVALDSSTLNFQNYYNGASYSDAFTVTNAGNMTLSGTLTFATSLNVAGVTLDETELGILDGATLSLADLNIIDGISDSGSLTAAELLYVDGVTSAIQTQLDAKVGNNDGSSTDNAIPRFHETTGYLLQDSGVLIDDSNNITIPGTVTVGTSTITLSSSSQVLTIAGTGGTYNEDLTFDMDVENAVNVSSGTGVTDISLTGLNISTTGVIKGRASYGADITGAVSHDTTATHGVFYHFTAAATVTLDAAADAGYGAQVCYRLRDAAEAAIIDIAIAEKINLNGTALVAGTGITATGAGESVCMVATTDTDGSGTDGWETWGATSEWASQ